LKLISWNVNGIRAVLKKGFLDLLAREKPDILCVQETKAHPDVVDADWAGYHAHWNWAEKKGYSGVLTLSREKPLTIARGIGIGAHDGEGRVLTTEFAGFHLVNVYVPNSQRELGRLPYRQEWDRAFLAYLKNLEQTKPVVFCGDLNVAHMPIDLARPKDNVKNHGFTPEERAGFDAFVSAGFVDTFRALEPGPGHYTWWSQMNKARDRNIGWRIDYFLCSQVLRPQLTRACIYKDVLGSDHCPVGVEFEPQPALKRAKRAAPKR
jgi:exodeoxyribonuclease III